MTREALLDVHIVAGTAGLVLGPVFVAVRRWRPATGPGYQLAVAVVAVTGAGLAVSAWDRLWWLLPVAVATEVAAVAGLSIRRRRRPGWSTRVPHVLGGSYVALVTGIMVASTKNPLFWLIPAVVAQLPIAVAKHRLARLEDGGAADGGTLRTGGHPPPRRPGHRPQASAARSARPAPW